MAGVVVVSLRRHHKVDVGGYQMKVTIVTVAKKAPHPGTGEETALLAASNR